VTLHTPNNGGHEEPPPAEGGTTEHQPQEGHEPAMQGAH
jgi:hypothetical protein